jgi:uncharacterized protein YciI
MHYLLVYDVGPEFVERRGVFRNEHLALIQVAQAKGDLLLAGALADPVDQELFLFQGDGPAAASRFAASDPYVLHGLVRSWRVRPWVTVAGAPLSPARTSP